MIIHGCVGVPVGVSILPIKLLDIHTHTDIPIIICFFQSKIKCSTNASWVPIMWNSTWSNDIE